MNLRNPRNPLLPFFDLALILALLLFGATGLGRLARHATAGHQSTSEETSGDELRHRVDSAHAEQTRLRLEGERLTEQLTALRRVLERKTAPPTGDIDTLTKLETEAQRLTEQLPIKERKLAVLERQNSGFALDPAKLEALHRQIEQLTVESARLEADNRDTQAAITRLAHESATRPVLKVEGMPRADLLTQRRPVYLVLTDNRVAPLRPPFYARSQKVLEAGPGRFEVVDVATRQLPGEPMDKALKPGSGLIQAIRLSHPEDHYVVFLVDTDSFAAFRGVREFTRDRGLRFGWEPFTETATIHFTASGRVVGEEVGAR